MGGQPYRVAYVIGELGKGGAEYQLHELLRGLDRERFAPHVFALASNGFWAEPIRRLDVPVTEFPYRRSTDPQRLLGLRRELRAFAPTILHTTLWSGNCYGRLAAIGLGIPLVITAERNVIRRPRWQVLLERLLDRITDAYLVNCAAIRAELADRGGIDRAKVHVIPNGIDLARLPAYTRDRRAARAAMGFDPDRRLVAQVGRLSAQKDYPTFLRAAATIAAAEPDVDFLVVGDGELRAELEALAASLGIASRVRFTGQRDDVPVLLGAVDVLALTSLYEGLPNVVIEAMAMGAVAVATDVGGCRELIEPGETGLLVSPQDAPAVVTAVRSVLRDPLLADRIAMAARRHVEAELAVEVMARRTMARYDMLVGARGEESRRVAA